MIFITTVIRQCLVFYFTTQSTEINLPYLTADATGPKHLTSTLTRSKFEQMIDTFVQNTLIPVKSALKDAGVDAVVAEGFEAGGHNGRDETTTLTLIPMVKEHLNIPLIAAGGIATGSAMLACMVLGADGVQVGSRFVASEESSAHTDFKKVVVDAKEGDTQLTLKELAPVRLIKNKFYNELQELYKTSPSPEQLKELLGRARAKRGMFEGDLDHGELEIGQISGLIHDIKPVATIVQDMLTEFEEAKKEVAKL